MERKKLTVNETLRFANHDFLNDLQIISMNLQLGKVEEALQWIRRLSEQSQKSSMLHKLPLPLTIEWLLTAKWRYPEFHFSISCHCDQIEKVALHDNVDMQLATYLEETIMQLQKSIDPIQEQYVDLQFVFANTLQLQCVVKGKWEETFHLSEMKDPFEINVALQSEEQLIWTIKVNYL